MINSLQKVFMKHISLFLMHSSHWQGEKFNLKKDIEYNKLKQHTLFFVQHLKDFSVQSNMLWDNYNQSFFLEDLGVFSRISVILCGGEWVSN